MLSADMGNECHLNRMLLFCACVACAVAGSDNSSVISFVWWAASKLTSVGNHDAGVCVLVHDFDLFWLFYLLFMCDIVQQSLLPC